MLITAYIAAVALSQIRALLSVAAIASQSRPTVTIGSSSASFVTV
jgi:hypothetical protein